MNNEPRCGKFRSFLPFIPLIVAAALALFTYGVYALWNGVLTPVLGVRTVTYWQALGLLVLSKLLFGGFGRGGPRGPRFGGWRRRRMAERLAAMTPEEREKFRQEMRERFGDWPRPEDCGPGTPS